MEKESLFHQYKEKDPYAGKIEAFNFGTIHKSNDHGVVEPVELNHSLFKDLNHTQKNNSRYDRRSQGHGKDPQHV